ncbi:MAG: MBL fold metallo-hydrolase [Chitinophagaceae bacterium]|nr:MBL fold metallo-hydrolase [Chitinophagaceae bacterium]
MYNIHLLPATFGDSILIEYGNSGNEHYILIDGGPYYVFGDIFSAIKKIAPGLRELELLVVTHIDIDHIDGIITLLNQTPQPFGIREVWFNGYKELEQLKTIQAKKDDLLGPLQGEYLSELIKKNNIPHNTAFDNGPICVSDLNAPPVRLLPGGMKLTILAPGVDDLLDLLPKWKKEISQIGGEKGVRTRWKKEKRYISQPPDLLGPDIVAAIKTLEDTADTSLANRSSIAFLAAYEDKTCLLAGDTPSDRLLMTIEPLLQRSGEERLSVDAWKLAHHGSKKSTHADLMQKVDSKKILISTDGKRYHHPDTKCIEDLLQEHPSPLHLFFNYRSEYNSQWDDKTQKDRYNYEASYPDHDSEGGISVSL